MEAQPLLHLAGLLPSEVILPCFHPVPTVTQLSLPAFLQYGVDKLLGSYRVADEKNWRWAYCGHRRPVDGQHCFARPTVIGQSETLRTAVPGCGAIWWNQQQYKDSIWLCQDTMIQVGSGKFNKGRTYRGGSFGFCCCSGISPVSEPLFKWTWFYKRPQQKKQNKPNQAKKKQQLKLSWASAWEWLLTKQNIYSGLVGGLFGLAANFTMHPKPFNSVDDVTRLGLPGADRGPPLCT